MKRNIIKKTISYIILIIVTLIYLIPFYIVLITSFKANNQIATQNPFIWFPTGEQLGLEGYKSIFTTYTIGSALSVPLHQLVAVKDDRERTVVQKLYLHIRTEPSCLHVGYAFTLPALLNDILVQLVCHIG